MLSLEIGELGEARFDLSLTGFDEFELGELFAERTQGRTDPDDAPEPPAHPVAEPGDLWVLGRHRLLCGDSTVASDVERVSNAATASFLVSAIQISCSARLALVCRLFGSLFRMLAVLCTQQRCSRVVGHTSPSAFQNPSAPSATAICGAVVRPRRFKSSSRSRHDWELSRIPSVQPTSSFLPSGVAPMITRMHCACSSSRASKWMPSAQQ